MKKNWIKNNLKKKQTRYLLILFVVGLVSLIGFLFQNTSLETATSPKTIQQTIVVDPGHGGIDPGKVGVNGAYEKDVNLAIGILVKKELLKKNCKVIMTRESDMGLYQDTDTNRKNADLKKRVEIMNHDEVDYIVSIHQNSYAGEASHGAQVFYQRSSTEGKNIAEALQKELIDSLDPTNHRQAKANDSYYLLKKTEKPMVIVECGFLSNDMEADKLVQPEYQKKVAQVIVTGLLKYINSKEVEDKDA